jgi:hypothetical protein
VEALESLIAYDPTQRAYTLGGNTGQSNHVLTAGDVLALSISGQDQLARVASGGYRGWYFVTADGRRGRFATSMKARLLARSLTSQEATMKTNIWQVTIQFEETRTTSKTLHAADTRRQAIQKALGGIPTWADWTKIKVKRAVVVDSYDSDPRTLVI